MKRIYASVLITNFNKEKFLLRTLNSCKNQNFKGKNCIVVRKEVPNTLLAKQFSGQYRRRRKLQPEQGVRPITW